MRCADVIGEESAILSQNTVKELKDFFLDSQISYVIDNYFKPSLVANSLFDIDFIQLRDDIKYRGGYYLNIGLFDQRHVCFKDFYNQEEGLLLDVVNRSEKIKTFDRLLREYLTIKDIELCPSGLVLREVWSERRMASKFDVIKSLVKALLI